MSDDKLIESKSILLDLIRYLLSVVVVVGHCFGFFLDYFDGYFPEIFPYPQSIAVMCFFYLSGYLIVGSQIRVGSGNERGLGRYLFDRFIRIYVTLIPSILFVSAVDYFFHKQYSASANLVLNYSSVSMLLDNILLIPSMPYGTMRPIWSLMYEWWIYLLFGGIFYLRSNFYFGFICFSLGAYFTFLVNASGEAGHIWVIWMVGGICAFFKNKILWNKCSYGLINSVCIVLFVFSIYNFYASKNSYNILAGVALALLLFLFTNKNSGFLTSLLRLKLVAKNLAGFSFTLFLTHYTVLIFVNEVLSMDGWYGFGAGFVLSNIVAYSIANITEYKLVEIKNFIRALSKSIVRGRNEC
jgi:peptidoglycan/LPS O-acetylase OafA/YrhL